MKRKELLDKIDDRIKELTNSNKIFGETKSAMIIDMNILELQWVKSIIEED